METSITVAIISAAASVIVAALSFALNKWAERKTSLQQRKIAHYQELLNALSDLAVDGTDKEKANQRFANAANTIALVAPQYVIEALMKFHDEVKFSNPNRSLDGHDRALKTLLLAIRKSLELPFRDDPESFNFHLIGSSPK
jgi:hypothetical protein